MSLAAPLLAVRDLAVEFELRDGTIRVVEGVSFDVSEGEIVGVVGESGSGKSVTMMSLIGLVPKPGRVVAGDIIFRGTNIRTLGRRELRELRGRRIAVIPPDAAACLNPVARIGDQVAEILADHNVVKNAADKTRRSLDALHRAGLPKADLRARSYPHELSGGMQQRVLIAMGIALGPDLLIADEPTTALDVTIQAQILQMLLEIKRTYGTAVILVTHDLAVAAEVSDRILVMYAGRIVEVGPANLVLHAPRHPYTRSLIRAVPPLGKEVPERLSSIPGAPPDPRAWPSGCRFAPRCDLRERLGNPSVCVEVDPPLRLVEVGHSARCHFSDDIGSGMSPVEATH